MQPTISMSLIPLFLSLSLTLWTLCCPTTAKEMVGCKKVCKDVTTKTGLHLSGSCEEVCPDGVILPPKDVFHKATDEVLAGKRKESDSRSDSIQEDHKRKKLEENSCNYELLQNSGKQQLLKTEPSGHIAVNVGLEITNDGEYILKIKRSVSSSTEEDELKRAKQMAQNAAMLSFYGEMLQDIGEKLHAQSRASLRSIFEVPAPYYSKSD